MLQVGSALNGYKIEASDGAIGSVSDFLFDDRTWNVRWLVVDTGHWLTARLVLVHPSAIGRSDYIRRVLPVALSKAQIKASPDIIQDQPVSRQNEFALYDYYGWDPVWGNSYFGPTALPPDVATQAAADTDVMDRQDDYDPHLRSLSEVTGYDIQATNGAIGHLESVLLEADPWSIRYLIIDTRNWWPGEHVLLSPYAVHEISYPKKQIVLNASREQVKTSPLWTPLDLIDQAYEKRLHLHYDWPGYGW